MSPGLEGRAGFEARGLGPKATALARLTPLLFLSLSGIARAEPAVRPSGNLLAELPAPSGITTAEWKTITDSITVRAGSAWPDPKSYAVIHGTLDIDLQRSQPLRELFVQVDADQPFDVATSDDARSWTAIQVSADPAASGMVARVIPLPAEPARYVRVAPRGTSGVIPVAEIALRSLGSATDPGALRVSDDGRVVPESESRPSLFEVDVAKLGIAALALLVLLATRTRQLASPRGRKISRLALGVLGVAAVLAYFRFGAYRYPAYAHPHDLFHYFVGAKYFPELGYDGLYECAVVAEAEAGFTERALARSVRDLRTNELVDGARILARSTDCRRRFDDERWRRFTSDVRFFANTGTVLDWNRVIRDHGFNAAPPWVAVGHALVRNSAADKAIGRGSSMFTGWIPALDPLLLVVALALVVWAFGAQTAGVALVVFGCNPLADFSWVGGSFLRELWFVCLLAGVCLLVRERPKLGGACLGAAALFQLFPVVALGAIGLAAVFEQRRAGRFPRDAMRALSAAALVIALGLPFSAMLSGRGDTTRAFVENTAKHNATPALNLVGLPTALSYRSSTRAELLFDAEATDAFARVRAARTENLRRARPLFLLGVALGVGLLLRALWRSCPQVWKSAALGIALVPFALEIASYYTAWLVVLSLLGKERMVGELAAVAAIIGALIAKYMFSQDAGYAVSSVFLLAAAFTTLLIAGNSGPEPKPEA